MFGAPTRWTSAHRIMFSIQFAGTSVTRTFEALIGNVTVFAEKTGATFASGVHRIFGIQHAIAFLALVFVTAVFKVAESSSVSIGTVTF
jgi:hypothetical protein